MSRRLLMGVCCFVLTALTSCNKDQSTDTGPSSPIVANISADSSLNIFYTAVIMANELQLLNRNDSVTVLAPTNTAFYAARMSMAYINALPVPTLDSLVLSYVLTTPVARLSSGNTSFTTLLGTNVYGSSDGTNDYFNGSQGTVQKVIGSTEGLIKLNSVIAIPLVLIHQLLTSDTTISLFNEALIKTNLINTAFAGGWATVLIPDNNAFNIAGFPDIASIDNADPNLLTNIISYHILNGQFFTSNLASMPTVGSKQGGTISIINNNGVLLFTGNNGSYAGIRSANQVAGNVVVHKIDHVLMP